LPLTPLTLSVGNTLKDLKVTATNSATTFLCIPTVYPSIATNQNFDIVLKTGTSQLNHLSFNPTLCTQMEDHYQVESLLIQLQEPMTGLAFNNP
jgi:hypothetical protein